MPTKIQIKRIAYLYLAGVAGKLKATKSLASATHGGDEAAKAIVAQWAAI
jgi:hypothetical protein